MQQYKRFFGRTFIGVGVFAALFIITEMVLQSFGKSICQTEGCKLVTQYTRFGDISILLFGLVTFSLLSVLSYLAVYRNKTHLERYINILLVVSLAAEGFFAGYQAFRLSTACVFCLITMVFFMTLAVLRLLYGEKEMISGFLAFAGVFALFYLVLPVGGTVTLPDDELVLFYSKDCKYCSEVIKEFDANDLKVTHLLVGNYAGFLQGMGIEHVPTLYINRKNQKVFLTGKEAIDQYLNSRQNPGSQQSGSPAVNNAGKPGETKKDEGQRQQGAAPSEKSPHARNNDQNRDVNRLFIPPDNQFNPFAKPDDPGICKPVEKCD